MYTIEQWISKTKDKELKTFLQSKVQTERLQYRVRAYADMISDGFVWNRNSQYTNKEGKSEKWGDLYDRAYSNPNQFVRMSNKGKVSWWISKIEDPIVKALIKSVYDHCEAHIHENYLGCSYFRHFNAAINFMLAIIPNSLRAKIREDIIIISNLLEKDIIKLKVEKSFTV